MSARYLDVAGAMEYLTLSERAIRTMVARQEIPHIKVGTRLRFDVQDLDLWMRRQRIGAS